MIEYNNFQKSLKNLEAQFENYKTLDDNLPKIIQEAVAESVIQRFEICWDCLWKLLKRHLAALRESACCDCARLQRGKSQ